MADYTQIVKLFRDAQIALLPAAVGVAIGAGVGAFISASHGGYVLDGAEVGAAVGIAIAPASQFTRGAITVGTVFGSAAYMLLSNHQFLDGAKGIAQELHGSGGVTAASAAAATLVAGMLTNAVIAAFAKPNP